MAKILDAPDYDALNSLTEIFFRRVAAQPNKPFLWSKDAATGDNAYHPLTWGEAGEQVRNLAAGLRALGVHDGDRVVLCAENRPQWLIADFAIMAAGGISVPAYTTNTTHDHLHILDDCSARAAIISNDTIARRFIPATYTASHMAFTVTMDTVARGRYGNANLVTWDDALAAGKEGSSAIEKTAARIKREDTACLIYTSGTGGAPKGVMLSHGAILHNCKGAHSVLKALSLEDEVFLSFLPLSHSYEHTAGQCFPVTIGAQIYYAEGTETLATNLKEARPTIMTAVPRLYETMYQRITRGIVREKPFRRKLFEKAVALGTRNYEHPGNLSTVEKLQNAVLDFLVRRKIRARFGGRLKALISGGAPLNYEVGVFFTALGMRLLQGYGLTEAAPVISCNMPGKIKIHAVGPPLTGVEVKIATDGEILVRGELVMQGYWNNPKATAETIRDGWLHTGDIGRIDADGYIQITDRKKDIIVNSGGDNISPQRIEGILTLQPIIAQAMVYGDKKPYLVALLTVDEQAANEWAASQGKKADLRELAADKAFLSHVNAAVEQVNGQLSQLEKIRRFMLADEPFTVDNELLTPTMKIRRHQIREIYRERLEALYQR